MFEDNNELVKKAFIKLYSISENELEQNITLPKLTLNYSGRFSDYNGNVKMISSRNKNRIMKSGRGHLPLEAYSELNFSLSKLFIDVDESIQIGMVQHLLNKVYKTNYKTLEQDFYNNFVKQLSKQLSRMTNRGESDPLLIELFNELNEEYFNGLMEQPILVFGRDSKTTLGYYQYSKDKVTVSTILRNNRLLLKFVLYHELLHKKHSFETSASGRSRYHTKEFRKDENEFSIREGVDVEKELSIFVKKKRVQGLFKWF